MQLYFQKHSECLPTEMSEIKKVSTSGGWTFIAF